MWIPTPAVFTTLTTPQTPPPDNGTLKTATTIPTTGEESTIIISVAFMTGIRPNEEDVSGFFVTYSVTGAARPDPLPQTIPDSGGGGTLTVRVVYDPGYGVTE